jgi:hypothetical protein
VTPERRTHLGAAAQRRSHDTRQRARAALRRLDETGDTITFAAVAAAASVSRSWLYRDVDIRSEIERLRHATGTRPAVPAGQRATDASLKQRLDTMLDANRDLRQENQQLRDQIAALLGEQRARTAPRPTGRRTGPCS